MVLNETTAPALESVPEAVVAKASKVDAAPIFEEPDSLPSSSSPTPLAPLPTSHPKPRGQSTFDWFAPSPLRASHSKQSSLALGSNGGDGTGGDGEGEEHEFRGAFTEDDTERGARFMRSASTDTEQLDTVREGEGPSSTPMAKGRKTRETAGGDSQWEDATQDGAAVATEGQTPKRPFVGRASSSLWSPAGRKKGMGGVVNDAVAAATEGSPTGKAKTKRGTQMRRATTGGWVAIRNKLKGTGSLTTAPANKTLTGHELIAELSTGVLPLVMIKMATIERDEHGQRRIPVLMNYVKLRITDSLHPLHDSHSVFRIELEYGDGLLKWVIYRELKDFVNLHAHFRVANLRHGIDKFPAFPKTSLPYLNWLKGEKRGAVRKADFAKAQRKSLETYLLQLIRATMFGPGANRLCKFLEISAMSIALATRGGNQGKQGYLRIMSSGASRRKATGFHPFSWKNRHEPKWFIVRDSYILAVSDPASTEIYDVFLIDETFQLERPARLLRQGLHLFSGSRGPSENDPDGTDDLAEKRGVGDPLDPSTTNLDASDPSRDSSNHTFYLTSSERKLRLVAKTERQQDQFIASIEQMVANSAWAGKNRFDSFAPIRLNCSAQWLIDGRDYFWSLSRAILMAKEKIYIHDWWLSPELYLRRPAADNEKWRLDRLLKRKAEEGVHIFVIIYQEVSNDFTPVDSNYTKTTLRALHPNIHVQRSPSHTSAGTLLWSHHEKMCVIDETIGFMGGVDLCFGRWDTPGHVLVDDSTPSEQIWVGKDYSNSRVIDFHTLDKPMEDIFDRNKVPRQPWHDIGLQIIGQPARDLCRHFVQRWDYLLRTKNHTVEMPFLFPAPDFTPRQLQEQGIVGTCEVQICRSIGSWSNGVSHTEHSIQNAYIKAIQLSEYFVYVENQFFITSTVVEGVVIENKIGDALVSRILRAHSEGTRWRAVIVIPLVPGYPFPIDHGDAGSVRVIIECQNRSICRGEHSIFGRLREEGIDPDDYISFFSLRGWGKLSTGALTTEAVYIHAKALISDDRVAIIGSANINERSQRGDRDSELACVIRDTDMIPSMMAGKPYQVGRFAHTMRVRLMQEHLGLDVDEIEAEEPDTDLLDRQPDALQQSKDAWDPDSQQTVGMDSPAREGKTFAWASRAADRAVGAGENIVDSVGQAVGLGLARGPGEVVNGAKVLLHGIDGATPETLEEDGGTHATKVVEGRDGTDGFASTVVPTLEEKVMVEGSGRVDEEVSTGMEHGRSMNQKERADGVSVVPPQGDDSVSSSASPGSTPASPPVNGAAQAPASSVSSPTVIHDTRQIPMEDDAFLEKDGDKIRPLAPITEQSEGRTVIHDAAPPSDTARSSSQDSSKSSPLLSKTDTTASSRPSSPDIHTPLSPRAASPDPRSPLSPGGSSRAKANEIAASRNAVTGSLRRNLQKPANPYNIPVPAVAIEPGAFVDPLDDSFYKDVWLATAVRNTQAFRKVFRCIPDDLVQTWKQYREFQTWAERHNKAPKDVVPPGDESPYTDPANHSGQHGSGGGGSGGGAMGQGMNEPPRGETMFKTEARKRSGSFAAAFGGSTSSERRAASGSFAAGEGHDHEEGFPALEREQMEACLEEVRGHLVIYPTRFLEAESSGGNFLFSKDRIAPLAIYN